MTQIKINEVEYVRLCNRCGLQFIAYQGQRKCNACYSGWTNTPYRIEMETRIREVLEVENQ